MRIVIAPQAFKGSMTATEATRAIADGARRARPDADIDCVPVADGGDGTLDALVAATNGSYRTLRVTGPLGECLDARWGLLGDGLTAVVELAQAAGLVLVPPMRRDPRLTTTYGVGELLRHALDAGCRNVVLCVGGSATNDAGVGMAQALGVRMFDAGGRDLPPGGIHLRDLARIDVAGRHPALVSTRLVVAVDVTNLLCGPHGASAVYGPQKGATPAMVAELEAALAHFAEVVRRDLRVDVTALSGGGAAGGAGAGALALLGAELKPGFDIVAAAVGLRERLAGADLVLTGEGRLDATTALNKAPLGVARLAAERGIPCICFAGSLGDGYEALLRLGVTRAVAIAPEGIPLDEAMHRGPALLAAAVERALMS